MNPAPGSRGERQLFVLPTGGSIDKIYTLRGHMDVGPPAVASLLEQAGVTGYTVLAITAKDSLDLTDQDRERLSDVIAELPTASGVVVTHGTDTMPETARYLLARRQSCDGKTVVLTGALQPAKMIHSDAAFNIGSAVLAARTLDAGVYVVMHGTLFAADDVRKDYELGRFTSG